MPKLEKRKDGGWSITYVKADGKHSRVSIKTLLGRPPVDEVEAEQVFTKWMVKSIQTEYSPAPRETLADLLKRYEQFAKNRWGKETYRVAMPRLTGFIQWAGEQGAMYPDQVKPILLEDYRHELLGRGSQPITANRHLEVIRAFFNRLHAWQMIDRSPVDRLEMQKVHKSEIRILTDEELQLLLVSCKVDPELFDVIFLAIQTGMRRGEIERLKWEDVKSDGIHLPITKSFRPRTIPYAAGVQDMLTRRRTTKPIQAVYVFDNGDGTPISGNVWYHRLRDQYAKLGITGADFHALRHTFASRLIRSGANIKVVQSLMGHADISTTMQYIHLYDGDRRRAVEALSLPDYAGYVSVHYVPTA